MSRTQMPQTHENSKVFPGWGPRWIARTFPRGSMDVDSVCRNYQQQLSPPGWLQSETAPYRDPLCILVNLSLSSAAYNNLYVCIIYTIYIIHIHIYAAFGCCLYISIRVHGWPDLKFSVCLSVCLSFLHYLTVLGKSSPKPYRPQCWSTLSILYFG